MFGRKGASAKRVGMRGPWRRGRGRLVGLLGVGALAAAGGGSAVAGHLTAVKSYTGCLISASGTPGVIGFVKEGNAPSRQCPPGSSPIHFSGGDVTAIAVGPGLTGGGDSGAVTIGLSDEQTLPGCTNGQVPKWSATGWTCAADNDTQYAAGTGLQLSGGQFSVAPGYRVTNNQSCPGGEFATGINGSGSLACSAPATSSAFRAESPGTVGIPDNGAWHTMVSRTLPAGSYAVIGSVEIGQTNSGGDEPSGNCELRAADTQLDLVDTYRYDADFGVFNEHTLIGAASLPSGGTIDIRCKSGGSDSEGIGAVAKILAVQVGSVR